jgi:N-acetylmuramoyl-L-alanine amidase
MMGTADIAAGKAGLTTGIASLARFLFLARGAALLLTGLAAGCQQPDVCLISLPEPTFQPQITVYELANRLNLDVRQVNTKHALLSNGTNTVLLPTGPSNWAYVNGKPVTRSGGACVYAGAVWVPAGLADILRGYLVPSPRPNPPWEVRPPLAAVPLTAGGFHIVIDPGHGGKDPGAISVYGVYEKTINLAVARSVAARLAGQGIRVTLTREVDRFVELDERAAVTNRAGADLFVSVHADSSSNRRARGCTVYVCRDAANVAVQAATATVRAMTRTGLASRGVRRADYRVLTQTQCPAVLVELGYLSNPAEARLLADNSGQQRLAESLTEGLLAFVRASGGG